MIYLGIRLLLAKPEAVQIVGEGQGRRGNAFLFVGSA